MTSFVIIWATAEVGGSSLNSKPVWEIEARRVVLVSVSNKATVQVEKTTYSVPSGWARLEATMLIILMRFVETLNSKPNSKL